MFQALLAFLILLLKCSIGKFSTTMVTNDDTNWWHHAVIYQIYPRSFKDGNSDGIGDLMGIIDKLEYLAETGITATWLSPIFESPMIDFGYDISDFKAIHHEYGTMDTFEQLIAAANKFNIKIILDFVPNHTSNKCEWFLKSEQRVEYYKDFYVWADGKRNADSGEMEPPNNWISVFYGSAWTWSEKRQQFYLHQFAAEQPDLNFRNAKVIQAMDDIIHFWLDKGVAGLRIDAVNHLFEDPHFKDEPLSGKTTDKNSYDYTEHIYTKDLPEVYTMIQHWRTLLDNYTATHDGPMRIIMTEAYADIKELMDYYEDASGHCGAHFPFNFQFITDLKRNSDARDFVFHIQKWLTYMPTSMVVKHTPNWLIGNHDNARVASRYGRARVDAMNMLIMMLPGVAVTYNGEEIGMEDFDGISWEQTVDPRALNVGPNGNYKELSRDPARTPFQWDDSNSAAGFSNVTHTWLPVHSNYKNLNLAQQIAAPHSHYKVYKALIQLRQLSTLRQGSLTLVVLNRDVFAFKRELYGHSTIVTVINVAAKQHTIDLSEFLETSQPLEVLITGSQTTNYKQGAQIMPNAIKMLPFEGIVCELSLY